LIAGQMDEFSDLDLVLAVAPAAVAEVSESRMDIARSLGSLLAGFTGEHVGEPRLLICLYKEPLLHVDLKFVSVDDFGDRVEDPVVLWERDSALTRAMGARPAVFPMPDAQWIEDRFWVWVHYAATKLGRGELFEVIDFIAFLRLQVLGPMAAVSKGHLPRGVRKLEQNLPEHVPAFDRTLAARQPESCAAALFAAIELYRDLRDAAAAATVIRRSEAEFEATAYLGAVARRAAAGRPVTDGRAGR